MSCCENVYEEGRSNSNLFVHADEAKRWAEERGMRGRVLDLDEASDLGTKDWADQIQGSFTANKQPFGGGLSPRHVVSSPPSVAPLLALKWRPQSAARNLCFKGYRRWAESGDKPGSV
jgi:hypothetical protein